jgi:hypothetical protein
VRSLQKKKKCSTTLRFYQSVTLNRRKAYSTTLRFYQPVILSRRNKKKQELVLLWPIQSHNRAESKCSRVGSSVDYSEPLPCRIEVWDPCKVPLQSSATLRFYQSVTLHRRKAYSTTLRFYQPVILSRRNKKNNSTVQSQCRVESRCDSCLTKNCSTTLWFYQSVILNRRKAYSTTLRFYQPVIDSKQAE